MKQEIAQFRSKLQEIAQVRLRNYLRNFASCERIGDSGDELSSSALPCLHRQILGSHSKEHKLRIDVMVRFTMKKM